MKKHLFTFLLTVSILSPLLLVSQVNIINTSFYSEALDENKNVDIYLPPGYDENPDLYYPVIYFLHGLGGSENSAGAIMHCADSLIRKGVIDPVAIVCANNGPDPFFGSFYMYSPLWGDYETYNVTDLINWVQSMGRAIPLKGYRALIGQSMGGYGCFRLGSLFKEKFRAIAAHGAPLNYDLLIEDYRVQLINEAGSGPPYFYDFTNSGIFTNLTFATAGAFAPNLQTPQEYIFPRAVEFPLDESGKIIDTVYRKWKLNDPVNLIKSLSEADSVAILFGDGENDNLLLYPPNVAFQDSLAEAGLTFEFLSHSGSHAMPDIFRDRALKFIDSILPPPISNSGLASHTNRLTIKWLIAPNPVVSRSLIQLSLEEKEQLGVFLSNILGEPLRKIFEGKLDPGIHQIRLDVSGLSPGLYVIGIESKKGVQTKKIVIQ